MDVPPEFLIKLEKSTAGSTFGCLPATGCRRFSKVALTLPYRQPVVSSPARVPAVYPAQRLVLGSNPGTSSRQVFSLCANLPTRQPFGAKHLSFVTSDVTTAPKSRTQGL
jgi:hypothetical protein